MPDEYTVNGQGIKVRVPKPEDSQYTDIGGIKVRPKSVVDIAAEKYPIEPHATNSSTLDKLIEFVRPVVGTTAPIYAGARAAAAVPGGPGIKALAGALAAGTTYFAGDTALQAAKDVGPKNLGESIDNSSGNAIIPLATEGLVRGVPATWRGLKEYFKPGSVISEKMSGLEPTYSKLKEKMTGEKSPLADWVERTFAPMNLAGVRNRNAQLGKQAIEGASLDQKTGPYSWSDPNWPATDEISGDPHLSALNIRKQAQEQMTTMTRESNARANVAELVADGLPKLVPVSPPQALTIPGPDMVKKYNPMSGTYDTFRVVRGPITLNSTVVKAQDFLRQKQEFYGDLTKASDSDRPLIMAAQRLIGLSGGTQGNMQPISFREAWDMQQEFGRLGYKPQTTNPSGQSQKMQTQFSDLYHSIGNDMENSMKNDWARPAYNPITGAPQYPSNTSQTGGQTALEAYRAAKTIVALRHETFGKNGIQGLVRSVNSPVPIIDRYLSDPVLLQKAVNAGEIQVPLVGGGSKLLSNNMRRDMGGYAIDRILRESWKDNPAGGNGQLDVNKMSEMWNDPKMQESYKALFSNRELSDFSQLFKNIAITQEKGSSSTGRVLMRNGAVSIPAALITGHMTNYTVGAGLLAGVELSGWAVARAMQDPKLSRALLAMSNGQPPNVSSLYLSRALLGALSGTNAVINMVKADGSKEPGTIKGTDFVPQTQVNQ